MPVHIELANLVIEKHVVAAKYPGGIDGFRAEFSIASPDIKHQEDGELFSIAAMNIEELYALAFRLKELGIAYDAGASTDEFVLISRYGGPHGQGRPDWLRCNSLHAWHTSCPTALKEKAERLGAMSVGDLFAMSQRGETVFGTLLEEQPEQLRVKEKVLEPSKPSEPMDRDPRSQPEPQTDSVSMSAQPARWKMVVAREFLLVLGILLIGLLTAGVLWGKDELEALKIRELREQESKIAEQILEVQRILPVPKKKWTPPVEALEVEPSGWHPPENEVALIEVEAPDGSIIEFPPSMSDEQIYAAMQKLFPTQKLYASHQNTLSYSVSSPDESSANRELAIDTHSTLDSLNEKLRTKQLERKKAIGSLKSTEQIWTPSLWVIIVLLIIAYPFRYLILAVIWSLRMVRKNEEA